MASSHLRPPVQRPPRFSFRGLLGADTPPWAQNCVYVPPGPCDTAGACGRSQKPERGGSVGQSEQEPSWKKRSEIAGGEELDLTGRREGGWAKRRDPCKKQQRGWRGLGLTPRVPPRSPGQQTGLSGEAQCPLCRLLKGLRVLEQEQAGGCLNLSVLSCLHNGASPLHPAAQKKGVGVRIDPG